MADPNSILIRGGRVIDPATQRDGLADLLIEKGKIAAIDRPGKIPLKKASRVIEAKGCWVLPGLIDIHVHLREPGFEYKET
ncbi:MAG: dihydroorotase, partial [Bdellovibrionota bacterium]